MSCSREAVVWRPQEVRMNQGDRVRVRATGETGTIEDIREVGARARYYVLFDSAAGALRQPIETLDPGQPYQPGIGGFYDADELMTLE